MTNQLQGTSLAIYNELKKRSIPVAGYKSGGRRVSRFVTQAACDL